MITTTDYYGKKYQADPKDVAVSIHVMRLACSVDIADKLIKLIKAEIRD